ncbi:MAG: M20/M25/M40 family metallo-hydrolase [Acidobacteria bacterium]|nr:M20/M25/M40 family metallo-hydrolase [Acidobacteriota bacterium]
MLRRLIFTLSLVSTLLAADAKSGGQRWWSHVLFLADDKLEGRNTGSEGHRKAAAYVAGEFERAGLKPAGTSGYIQPVKFRSRRIVESQSSLALVRNGVAEPLALGEDAAFSMRIEPAESVEAPIVFAGYGLTVPELNYDDLKGLDLKGKVVFYLGGGPSSIPGPLRSHYQSAGERWKFLRRAGAIGAISVQNPKHMDVPWERAKLARLQPAMSLADPSLEEVAGQELAVFLNPARADKFLAGSGHTFAGLLAIADQGKPLPTFAIPAAIRAKVRYERAELESQNVAAILPGSDPQLTNEYVVLSAHLDHVGVGEPIKGDRIYNGAMDNASGIATLLDIAASLHESKKTFRRSLLFVAVTGEEKGLLGSKYFAAHPTVKPESMAANLNFDMFLPLFPLRILTVYGLEESDLGPLVRQVAEPLGIQVQADQEPDRNIFIRSDQYNFIRRGIPALAFKVGYLKGSPEAARAKQWLTERYHAPSDDVHQPVDLTAAADFNKVTLLLAEAVANRTERPRWNDTSFFRRYAN